MVRRLELLSPNYPSAIHVLLHVKHAWSHSPSLSGRSFSFLTCYINLCTVSMIFYQRYFARWDWPRRTLRHGWQTQQPALEAVLTNQVATWNWPRWHPLTAHANTCNHIGQSASLAKAGRNHRDRSHCCTDPSSIQAASRAPASLPLLHSRLSKCCQAWISGARPCILHHYPTCPRSTTMRSHNGRQPRSSSLCLLLSTFLAAWKWWSRIRRPADPTIFRLKPEWFSACHLSPFCWVSRSGGLMATFQGRRKYTPTSLPLAPIVRRSSLTKQRKAQGRSHLACVGVSRCSSHSQGSGGTGRHMAAA